MGSKKVALEYDLSEDQKQFKKVIQQVSCEGFKNLVISLEESTFVKTK